MTRSDQPLARRPSPVRLGHFLTRAIEVQRQLAHVGGLHHRSVKIADLIIAASTEATGDVVWHYDADFDRIADYWSANRMGRAARIVVNLQRKATETWWALFQE